MKKSIVNIFLAFTFICLANHVSNAQVVNDDGRANAEIIDKMSNYIKDTDWIPLGKTIAYKDVKSSISGNLYVRVLGRKFFYKFEINGEDYVVTEIISNNNKILEFQQILNQCNALIYKDSPFYLAVPTW